MSKLIVFDFDGVLAIPYTNPEKHYEHIPYLIKLLASKYILAVASFNPRAINVLKEWGISDYFVTVRAGCNDHWEVYDDSLRKGLSKPQQIKNIRDELISRNMITDVNTEIYFYDDDQKNITETQQHHQLKGINAIFIDNEYGFTAYECNKHISFNDLVELNQLQHHPTPWLVKMHPLMFTLGKNT